MKIIKFFSFFIRTLIFYFYSFLIFLGKSLKKTKKLKTSERSLKDFTRFAIFAVYCDVFDENHKVIIKKLFENGYFIILANNGKLKSAEIEKIPADIYVERPGIGRDFGLYRYAAQWLYKNAHIADEGQVLFINDSIFYLEGLAPDLFKTIATMKKDCISMTEANSIKYHMTTWLFVFSGKVFKNKEIKNFWSKYISLNFKWHCIRKGEIKLTPTLQKAGYSPYIFYPSQYFISKIAEVKEDIINMLPINREVRTFLSSFVKKQTSIDQASLKCERDVILNALRELSITANQTHLFNLSSVYVGSFPFLKKDLLWRDIYSIAQIRFLCNSLKEKIGEGKSHTIFNYYLKRGRASQKLSPLKRLLLRGGLI